MPNIYGTPGNDHLTGSLDGDSIYGLAGNDVLSGDEGDDYLYGGDGNDILHGDAGADYLDGEAGSDTLFGGTGDDYLTGGAGADTLDAGPGENYVDGSEGIDTATYSSPRAHYTLQYGGGAGSSTLNISCDESLDHISGVERLQFADMHLALDLAGNAGFVARLIGAVLGPQYISYANYVGIGLFYLDQGAPQETLVQAVIDARLGPHAGNASLVDLVYSNLTGHLPSPDTEAYFTGFLDTGEWTQVQLAGLAMQSALNASNIGLAGLLQTGIAFEPW